MNKITCVGMVLGVLLSAQLSGAQPAIYRDNALSIPAGALIREDGSTFYFADIVLEKDGEGNFHVAQANARSLVAVDLVEVQMTGDFPVEVSLLVEGTKSVPCVELEPAAVSREGHEFTVVLAETKLGPDESCITVIDPFDTTIPLDVEGLEAGEYTVNVNGVEVSFTLDADNP